MSGSVAAAALATSAIGTASTAILTWYGYHEDTKSTKFLGTKAFLCLRVLRDVVVVRSSDCRQIHADDSVASGGLLLRRGLEAVKPIRDSHIGKARFRERGDKLWFQQSTRDSIRPELDILSCVVRQLDAEHYVRDLHAAAGFQDAPDLSDCRPLFRLEQSEDGPCSAARTRRKSRSNGPGVGHVFSFLTPDEHLEQHEAEGSRSPVNLNG
jgi:hypothetical protein